ncbi:hypothetical protein AYK26_02895 [Euryarchaeota archaeon SM23-78]|nr:MAG: hypothetical protein AYK26_02895 [Euryarchaeota archaeon SM23-78]MBW3001357.1 hypothetical protein [Candidatus Woesearchaeota archaeon]
MSKQKTGLVLFWIGIVYMILMAGVCGWGEPSIVASLSQTLGSFFFFLWGFSVPLGAVLSGIGLMLIVESKASRIALFGAGVLVLVVVLELFLRTMLLRTDMHFPWFFGAGGGIILLLFLGVAWFWLKKRKNLKGEAGVSADYQLIGYVFFLITSWYMCEAFGARFIASLETFTPKSPMNIMMYLLLGWLFMFLSQYKVAKLKK